jgi:hypothetical protein
VSFQDGTDRPRLEGELGAECALGGAFMGIKGLLREDSVENSALVSSK